MNTKKMRQMWQEIDWIAVVASVAVAVVGWFVVFYLFKWMNEIAHGGWPSEVIAIAAALLIAATFLWEYLEGPGGIWDFRFHR